MSTGTLPENVKALESAVGSVSALAGTSPNGQPGSGFAGAAALAESSPTALVDGLLPQLERQMSAVFTFDGGAAVARPVAVFTELKEGTSLEPAAALTGFTSRAATVDTAFSSDLAGSLERALEAVRSIRDGIPADRTAVVGTLLDQLLGVFASLDGPEAQRIATWIASARDLHRLIAPMLAEAQSSGDAAAVAIEVVRRSLANVLGLLGYDRIAGLFRLLDGLESMRVSSDQAGFVAGALTAVTGAYDAVEETLAGAPAEPGQPNTDFRDAVAAASLAAAEVKKALRPVLGQTSRIARSRIIQPNGLEDALRAELQRALAVEVQQVQKIDDPFKELFDRIDGAVEQIDLSSVRADILSFFASARATIEGVDIPSLAETLGEPLAALEGAVTELEQGVTGALAEVEDVFRGLEQRLRQLAEGAGTFQPDGTFRFAFEDDLHRLFATAHRAIGGDPANPAAPSVAGTLGEAQTAIDGFVDQLTALLQPLQETVEEAVGTAVGGINDFKTYVESVDVGALMEQLRGEVDKIVDALVPIDLAVVFDPVVAAIDENTEKVRSIDASDLNDLLREALAAALGVIIEIDFAALVSEPLRQGFAELKAVPAEAIEELQRRYQQAIDLLDQLSPTALLEALATAFTTIDDAVSALEVTTLLRPLDELHAQHLKRPLSELRPSTLLQPVADAFDEFTSVFDGISGAELVAPVTDALERVKDAVGSFDVGKPIDDLLATIDGVKQDLREIRPSVLMAPLVAELERLERELDRFKPSIVFEPIKEIAEPLLAGLETIQQETVETLHELFQAPLELLESLKPEALTARVKLELDAVISAVESLGVRTAYADLKGRHFDLKRELEQRGDQRLLELATLLDPEDELGPLVAAHDDLLTILRGARDNLDLTMLADLYLELKERLLAMLPPYARELLDPEAFKRVMRLADPTRFLAELDERFEAVKSRLIPIRPQEIVAELDGVYEEVLALVDELDVEEPLQRVRDAARRAQATVTAIRIDFVADNIDAAIGDLRAVADALDPARVFAELDAVHAEVVAVVDRTVPSTLLAGLQEPLDVAKGIVAAVDPRVTIAIPLEQAWEAVDGLLAEFDVSVVLSPVVEQLDELELALEDGIERTEAAFDELLAAAQQVLSGSGAGAGAAVTV